MISAGISTACLYPRLTEDALLELAKRGVDLVEIFINSDCELKPIFVNELKTIINTYGVKVSSIHPYTCGIEPMMYFTQYQRRFLDILDYYKKYFQAMNILGAEFFVFHGNKDQNLFPNDLYFERYEKLFDLGKEFGITVAQENVSRCSSGNLEFLKIMSKALGEKAKFVLDTKQAVRKGYNPYEFIDALGNKIVHIHISDHGEKGDCLLINDGILQIDNFVKQLKLHSFTGSIILELYSDGYADIDDLTANLSYIKNTIKQIR